MITYMHDFGEPDVDLKALSTCVTSLRTLTVLCDYDLIGFNQKIF